MQKGTCSAHGTGMRYDYARYVDGLSWEASKAADRGDQSCLFQLV